jgi:hypothetical protein
LIKQPVAGLRTHFSAGKIQPMLLFFMGLGFVLMGVREYPAFIAVGALFLIVGYRGYTCERGNTLKSSQ